MTDLKWPVTCTQPACDHTARIADDVLDAYLCGSDAVCGCHLGNVAELLDVLPFKCGAA